MFFLQKDEERTELLAIMQAMHSGVNEQNSHFTPYETLPRSNEPHSEFSRMCEITSRSSNPKNKAGRE